MSALHGNHLYVLGGWDGIDCLNIIEKADLNSNTPTFTQLEKGSGLQGPVKNGTCCIDDGKIIIIGGWDERETKANIWVFDPVTECTSFVGTLPKGVEGHSIAKVGSIVYIIGGFDGYGVTDSIMSLDLSTRHSEILDITLDQKRENHTCEVVKAGDETLIIVNGGWSGS